MISNCFIWALKIETITKNEKHKRRSEAVTNRQSNIRNNDLITVLCYHINQICSFNQTVAVLSFGWTSMRSFSRKSRSRYNVILRSVSFKMPRGVTAPGINLIILFQSSAEANDNARAPFFLLERLQIIAF